MHHNVFVFRVVEPDNCRMDVSIPRTICHDKFYQNYNNKENKHPST